jgi:tRNA (guanine-N7-)-methyltransferase
MSLPVTVVSPRGEDTLQSCPTPLDLEALVPGRGPWEVELGFGKGRHLLESAGREPETRFLGVEMAGKYFRVLVSRARRRGLTNLLALQGEALSLLGAVLPRGFARALHVYFPDPWPKARHQRRRLFDSESVDLLVAILEPHGRLAFATDFLEYGEEVAALLASYPGLDLRRLAGPWPEGPRTNYEAKYVAEGRPILRLEAVRNGKTAPELHPGGRLAAVVGYAA